MNKALQEALHTIPKDRLNTDSEALQEFKETFGIENVDNEKWLQMPRKFTRSAARFTLPINTQKLSTLTPYEYLSQYIWISDHRKQLYRYVFNKYLIDCSNDSTIDDDIDENDVERDTPNVDIDQNSLAFCVFDECIMPFRDLRAALVDVLGYCGSIDQLSERINEFFKLVNLNETEHSLINFRSWCGLVAFAERFLNPTTFDEDPCDEVCSIFVLMLNL